MGNQERLSVDELLQSANSLFDDGPYRAAIMEAMTALEERVNEVVFDHLERHKGLPGTLVAWIREKPDLVLMKSCILLVNSHWESPLTKASIFGSNTRRLES